MAENINYIIMKKFLAFILLLNSSLLFSQLKMEGKVTDSLNKPLELANIILINSETNALESLIGVEMQCE